MKKANPALVLERNILRGMIPKQPFIYYRTDEGERNNVRFQAVRDEISEGYGFSFQKCIARITRRDWNVEKKQYYTDELGIFEYIYVRSSKE